MSREEDNLSSLDAKKKFRELVDEVKVCMLVSDLSSRPLNANPMQAKEVDKAGNIWFLTGRDSQHYQDLEKNPLVNYFSVMPKAIFSAFTAILKSTTAELELKNCTADLTMLISTEKKTRGLSL